MKAEEGAVGHLTDAQRTAFERDGFLIYGALFAPEEIEELRERLDAMASGEHPASEKLGIRLEAEAQQGGLQDVLPRDRVWQVMGATRHDPRFFQHAADPRILDIVQELLGTENIRLFADQALMKPAHHGSEVSWHQDSAYWTSIDPPALVSCWTALDPVTEENGCVRMIPGSQREGVIPHRRDVFLHAEGIDTGTAVPVTLPLGGCSFHHSCTVHGSAPNRTPHRRRGFVTSYMRADSHWLGDPNRKPDFPLLRGQEHPGGV